MRHATCNMWHKLQEIYLFKFHAACIEYSLVAAERIIWLPLTCFCFCQLLFVLFLLQSLCVLPAWKLKPLLYRLCFCCSFFLLFFCFCAAYLVFFCAAEKLVCQFAGVSVRFCPGGNCLLDFPLLVICCCCCCCCLSLLIALCNCVCANCESYF